MRITTRLILLLVGVVTFVMGAYAVVTLAQTRARVSDELQKKADHLGMALAVGTLHHLEDDDADGVQDVVNRITHHEDVTGAAIFDLEGRLVASAGPPGSIPEHSPAIPPTGIVFLPPEEGGPAYACVIQDAAGAAHGSLQIRLREMSVLPYVIPQRDRILVAIGVLSLVLSAAVYWSIRRLIADPLRELAAGAETIGRGELSHRIAPSGSGEVAELAGVFNRMAASLETSNRACEEERDRIRRVVDGMPEGVVVLGANGRIAYWNRTMERRYAVTSGEAVGRPLGAALPCVEDRGVLQSVEDVRNGRATSFRVEDVSLRLAPDRSLAISGTVLPDSDSLQREVVLVLADTTERRAAEEAVRSSELRLRAVMNSVLEGIITIDTDGRIRSYNRAAETMFGYDETEITGRNVRDLMPEPYASNHDGYIRAYLETGEKRIIGVGRQVEGRRKDGSVFPVDLSVSEFSMNGERMFAGTLRDITEKLQLEQQVQRSQQLALVGELAAGIAHEIGTPLNVISGTAEYLLSESGTSEPQTDDLRGIQEEVNRIAGLVQRLMEFARHDEPRDDVIQLNAAVNSVLLLLGRQMEKASVGVKLAVVEDLPPIRGDQDQIQQVLLNLVMNAWQVMPHGGQLEIRAGCEEAGGQDQVVLRVADTGPGTAEEHLERLFDPFFTTKRPGEGTGLGLSIVQRIVDAHGGRITARNRPGRGAVFEVRLPVADREV